MRNAIRVEDAKFMTVHFPDAEVKTFSIGKRTNVKRGIMAREVFISNYLLWKSRGYEIKIW